MTKKINIKLYCYVDETGQDTNGRLFIVAVIITSDQREVLRSILQHIERSSKKRQLKWTNTAKGQRTAYVQAIIENPLFKGLLHYSRYTDTKTYVDLTILSVAKAIHSIIDKTERPYEANIFVDGLKRSEQRRFAAGVRKLGVKIRKARGLRDQSDEFIRLADAVAGFTRDALENDTSMRKLLKTVLKSGLLVEV